jgi:predicted ribosome quality control (RQC) complex YloA/Tae2 family protein
MKETQTKRNVMNIDNQAQAVKKYQQLFEEHMSLLCPIDQKGIDRAREIQMEQAELERKFPGTLMAWMEE